MDRDLIYHEEIKQCVFISEVDWGGLLRRHQRYAMNMAAMGLEVIYFNRTPQRVPTIRNFLTWVTGKRESYGVPLVPQKGINIYSPRWLPPFNWLRFVNRFLIHKTAYILKLSNPLIITFVPTYNTLDFINENQTSFVAYICLHNYDASIVIPDLLKAEKKLIQKADILFADSIFNMKRLVRLSGGRKVYRSLPGVDYKLFHKAFRGDEIKRCKNIYYFGRIGPHLDLSLYSTLAKRLKVIFVGVIDPAIRKQIPTNVEIRAPVANSELPKVLRDADILAIFYKDSAYIQGVLPAKFFECLATGKPLLVSGLSEAKPYLDIVYDVQGSEKKALEVIQTLSEMEIPERLSKRDKIAKEADWTRRFESFVCNLDSAWRDGDA